MPFCFLYNVVSENHSVQNFPWGGEGSIVSSRSSGSNTDCSFTRAVSKSFLCPLEKNPIAADLG